MITDADVKKLSKAFVTKNDLKKGLDRFATKEYVDKRFERLFKYLDYRFQPLDKLVKDIDELNNKISTNLDFLMGKYTKFEDEHTVLTEQTNRVNGKLDNHEERIFSLEQRVVTP